MPSSNTNDDPAQVEMLDVANNQASGETAERLMEENFNVRALRPWIDERGRTFIARNVGTVDKPAEKPVQIHNATGTLRVREWLAIDEVVKRVARERLNLVDDLRGGGLTHSIAEGLGRTMLETTTVTDMTDARLGMDPTVRSEQDRPTYTETQLPLPIAFKDFDFNIRQLRNSRNTGESLDMTAVEIATRKVAEQLEKLHIGSAGTYQFNGGNVYGLTNFPSRVSASTLTNPTDSSWTAAQTVTDVLAMKQAAENVFHHGPFHLYHSKLWSQYLDEDYSASKGDRTLRERILAIDGINAVRPLDYLDTSGYTFILVQMTSDIIRTVLAVEFTTVQWDVQGGFRKAFKVMASMTPQPRADSNSNSGIVHWTTS